jgi:HAD superfamily hydrolase (TIGR01549 family)
MSEFLSEGTRAVLYDHNDTLVETFGSKIPQFQFAAREWYGKDLKEEEIRANWGGPFKQLCGILFETDDIELAYQRVMTIHHNYPQRVFPDTIQTLQRVHSMAIMQGVVTSTTRESFSYDAENQGLPLNLFEHVQTQEDTPFHKPDPRVFDPSLEFLETYGITPEEVTYVGDALSDFEAAQAVGFNFIGVEQGIVTAEEFRAAGAFSVSSLSKIIRIR